MLWWSSETLLCDTRARSYMAHHTQRISLAVVKADACGIIGSFQQMSAKLSRA